MRVEFNPQLNLVLVPIAHAAAMLLATINLILNNNRAILPAVLRDIQGDDKGKQMGRHGMTAEQVLRALIIKQLRGLSYEELAFNLLDSETARSFLQINSSIGFGKSALQDNISKISEPTMRMINNAILQSAANEGIEDGAQVRTDCTVVETNIHRPTDSSLLNDVVRVLCRIMQQMQDDGVPVAFRNRSKQAKRAALAVLNAKNDDVKVDRYKVLIKAAKAVLDDARKAAQRPDIVVNESFNDVIKHGDRVVEQTVRRVIDGKPMSSSEKIVSIFEAHTDIIVKDRRETYFGHKVCLTTGKSNMVIDLKVLSGNPADSELAPEMIERVIKIYGQPPTTAAFDGGFASKQNLEDIKAMGVENVPFSKRRGIEVADMVPDPRLYKSFRNFRAGVEGNISYLKRCFGLSRCNWKSAKRFNTYCWGSVLTMNLVILARHMMAV